MMALLAHLVYWGIRSRYSAIDPITLTIVGITTVLLLVQLALSFRQNPLLKLLERFAALNITFAIFSHYYISIYVYEGDHRLVLISSITQWVYVVFITIFVLFRIRAALMIATLLFVLLLIPMIDNLAFDPTVLSGDVPFLLVNLYLTIIFLLPVMSGFSVLRTLYNQTLQRKNQSDSMARTDPLTNIPNRRALDEQLDERMEHATRYRRGFSIAIIDIDFFKQINDRHGHPTGDRVLVKATGIFQQSIRAVDMIGRWGGEEFLLIMPETSAQQAVVLVERLRQEFSRAIHGDIGLVTASAGVAMYRHGDTLEALIARADAALYQAKAEGRDRIIAR